MSWQQQAEVVIYGVIRKHQDSGTTDKKRIAAEIDAAYPFGERAHWPYKAWLKARRRLFPLFGLPLRARAKQVDAPELF